MLVMSLVAGWAAAVPVDTEIDPLAPAPEAPVSSEPRVAGLAGFTPADMGLVFRGGFFTEERVAYGIGRSTITLGAFRISADRLSLDAVTQVAEAEGDVIFEYRNTIVRASAARYDFRRDEGVAWDVEGIAGPLYFRSDWDEVESGPSFRRISEDEAVFRGSRYTTSGFPVPTWYLSAREIVILGNERILLKDAVLYVRGVPVMYFPLFSRSIGGTSPWSFETGFESRYGAYFSIRYAATHRTDVPDYDNPAEYRTRSQGAIGLRSDTFTRGVVGFGVDYRYRFDFDKHLGSLDIYGVRDWVRDLGDETDNQPRYLYRHRHNSLFGNWVTQWNSDYMSDPDVAHNFYDMFLQDGRIGRLPERRLRGAVTYLERDWIGRFSAELKDRLSLDEFHDPSEPKADDLDYDPDPDFLNVNDINTDGITGRRYGRVSERFQARLATRLIPLSTTPFFVHVETNYFTAIDPGLNSHAKRDDARFWGSDIYGALTHRARLDDSDRWTWTNTLGIGRGSYYRDSRQLIHPSELPAGPPPLLVDGVAFFDESSYFVGGGSTLLDYRDTESYHIWFDYKSRLNARFTENLSAYLAYTYRRGTKNSVGEYFERAGRVEAFEDIYNFPHDAHWLESRLIYSPLYPKVDTWVGAGANLQSRSDVFANERLYYVGTGGDFQSDSGEFIAETSLLLDGRQARDRQAPNDYRFHELTGAISGKYLPAHGRHWFGLDVFGSYPLTRDPIIDPPRKRARFSENDTDVSIRPLIGRQIGPKYEIEAFAEYNTRINDIKETGLLIVRDIHDADLLFFGGWRTDTSDGRDSDDADQTDDSTGGKRELTFRVGVRFKLPEERSGLSAVSLQTLRERDRQASYVE